MQNTAEILRAAAARVRQGWCQHRLTDFKGGVCAQGAMSVAAYGGPLAINWKLDEDRELWRWIALLMVRMFGERREIYDWNNAPEQTAENVAQGLEYAALLWEQEQAQLQAQDPASHTAPIPAK
jgi:hypothetical protein